MSHAHRRLILTWRKKNAIRYDGRWYRWDTDTPKGFRYEFDWGDKLLYRLTAGDSLTSR